MISAVKDVSKGKQYILQYPNGKQVVIGTVDSFIFALGDKAKSNHSSDDYFKQLA
jgi:hypothetical protein